MYPRPHNTETYDLNTACTQRPGGPGLYKRGGTVRPSGASPSPGLAETSALVHTWIQKGSIPRLTSWRSVISLSTAPPCTYHLLSHTSLAEPILYCLACRTLRSGPVDYVALPAVPAGASRSHILITHPFSEALLDKKREKLETRHLYLSERKLKDA